MLVAVFRPRTDGERTAARLRALGHEALLAPVLEIRPTGAAVPHGSFDGVIFTSAHGADTLNRVSARGLLELPCFCVGDRTADSAKAVGFRTIRRGRADAVQLAALICAEFAEPARLLLVTGHHRKTAIEQKLAAAGHGVAVAEVYAAMEVTAWPEVVVAAFHDGRIEAALHYSRRSADLALKCATAAGVLALFRAVRHHCLSDDATTPLLDDGIRHVGVAAAPNEDSLLRTLAQDLPAPFRGQEGR